MKKLLIIPLFLFQLSFIPQQIITSNFGLERTIKNKSDNLKTTLRKDINELSKSKEITIAFYLQDGVEVLDFAGPLEVFTASGFNVFIVSKTTDPIISQRVLKIIPDYSIKNAPKADILAFFGGNSGVVSQDKDVINWVIGQKDSVDYLFSVCTGAFILGEAGILDNQTVTTFHESIENLRRSFPKAKVMSDVRFVDNGRVITTAGISAGIDGALHLVQKILGKERAKQTSIYMEYDKWVPNDGLILDK